MSQLLARIMLAMLMLPSAAVVYMITFAVSEDWSRRNLAGMVSPRGAEFIPALVTMWLFIVVYWLLLWRRVVRWGWGTLGVTVGAYVIGGGVALLCHQVVGYGFGVFVFSVTTPLLWLIGTVLVWKETAQERAERMVGGKNALVCPTCGYNLTGLSAARCPECGSAFTLDSLLQKQPASDLSELGR